MPEFNTVHLGLFRVQLLHTPSSVVQAAVHHELQCRERQGMGMSCRGFSQEIPFFSEFRSLPTNRRNSGKTVPPVRNPYTTRPCPVLSGTAVRDAWRVERPRMEGEEAAQKKDPVDGVEFWHTSPLANTSPQRPSLCLSHVANGNCGSKETTVGECWGTWGTRCVGGDRDSGELDHQ